MNQLQTMKPIVKQMLPEFSDPGVLRVFLAISQAGGTARIAGGAVRDLLLGRRVKDIDFATDLKPDAVIEAGRAAGFRVIPTGIDHGTVTWRINKGEGAGSEFEITTLRTDVACDGRHAEVEFTDSWQADAERRDLTTNALYSDETGQVFDFVGGLADMEAERLRFVGDADARIREDFLRIMRLFRFSASLGFVPDDAALAASERNVRGLAGISRERLRDELSKLLAVDDRQKAAIALRMMQNAGVFDVIVPGMAIIDAHAVGDTHSAGHDCPFAIGLAALFAARSDYVAADRARKHLALSNHEYKTLKAVTDAVVEARHSMKRIDAADVKRLIWRHGRHAVKGTAERGVVGSADLSAELKAGLDAVPDDPVLPVSGRDLIALGFEPGKGIGDALKRAETSWIDSGFEATKEQLLTEIRKEYEL